MNPYRRVFAESLNMSEISLSRSGVPSGLRKSAPRWRLLWSLGLALVSLFAAAPARAASPDARAKRLEDQAMNQDYLATDFKGAEKKLKKAVSVCQSGCSTKRLGRILRDLATVYIVGLKDPAHGLEAMQNALAADPSLKLDPAYVTPELQSAYEAAGGKGKAGPASSGELQHEPVAEQRRGTPVPVYVEVPGDVGAKKFKLYYRSAPDKSWHSRHMHPVGDGYGAEIPCDAVTGNDEVRYYVRAVDDDDRVVASAGAPDEPYKVELVQELYGDAPRLPGSEPPESCSGGGKSSKHGPALAWLSLSLDQDLAFVGGDDVCSPQSQIEKGFSCFRQDGVQYHGTPLPGQGGHIGSGLALATTRLLLGTDLVLGSRFSVGLRLGYVLQGRAPQSDGGKRFFPLHAEARLAYYFSKDGMNGGGLVPFVFAAGGLAQVDVKKSVPVLENRNVAPPPSQIDNPPGQRLDAWKKEGMSFAGLGGGVYWELGHHNGILADLKLMQLFPSSGTAASLELGYTLGL